VVFGYRSDKRMTIGNTVMVCQLKLIEIFTGRDCWFNVLAGSSSDIRSDAA
jgi:hypothetical protein